mmetsp:Transcript_31635/g.87329  ORF Transcript_31635/g.87329 Transcript_31635/m.87329 type:complete len:310 (-) Transcript_31635:503-1432(-)
MYRAQPSLDAGTTLHCRRTRGFTVRAPTGFVNHAPHEPLDGGVLLFALQPCADDIGYDSLAALQVGRVRSTEFDDGAAHRFEPAAVWLPAVFWQKLRLATRQHDLTNRSALKETLTLPSHDGLWQRALSHRQHLASSVIRLPQELHGVVIRDAEPIPTSGEIADALDRRHPFCLINHEAHKIPEIEVCHHQGDESPQCSNAAAKLGPGLPRHHGALYAHHDQEATPQGLSESINTGLPVCVQVPEHERGHHPHKQNNRVPGPIEWLCPEEGVVPNGRLSRWRSLHVELKAEVCDGRSKDDAALASHLQG